MSMMRKLVPSSIKALADDEIEVRMSTAQIARDGHILLPGGCDLTNYRKNPVVLWNHDTDHPPVARSEDISVDGDEICARAKFPPAGISHKADEVRGLAKAGFLTGVSVGFDVIDAEPINPGQPKRGLRISAWELLEWSFCCVPVDTEALVTARAQAAEDWKCGASKDLPIDDSDAWDGPAAESSVFEWAGGDDFDPTKARKAFLAYNAAKPKERGSYKLPIAHVTDGRLKVPKGAIRAAASRLSSTDIPESAKASAQAVIDHYEEKAGMNKPNDPDRSLKGRHARALERAPGVLSIKRGLMEIGHVAWLLSSLGYAHECSEYEAALEGDNSAVPGMIGECLKSLGEALVAMTTEEVKELLEDKDIEIDEDSPLLDVLVDEERSYVLAGTSARARAFRFGIARARGRALSAAKSGKIADAQGQCARAMKHAKSIGDNQQEVSEHIDSAQDAHGKAVKSHGDATEALEAAKAEPDNAAEHVAKAARCMRAMAGHHEAIADAHEKVDEANQDAGDAHQSLGRSLKAIDRAISSVMDGADKGADGEDGDSKKIQTSAGSDESGGTSNDRSYAARQADLKQLRERAASL